MAKVFGENKRMCRIVTSMKVIIRMIKKMDMVSINGLVETFTKDNMSKMSAMVREK